MFKQNIVFAVALSLSATVLAEEKRPWDINLDLGAITTAGNTEATTVQAKIDAKQNLDHWQNNYIVSGLYKEDQVTQADQTKVTQKTAEKYLASLKSSYILTADKSYMFGFGSYSNDKFGAYRTYSTVALGYGDWLYSTEALNWFVEVGPGYFQGDQVTKGATVNDPDILVKQKGAILRSASTLVWHLTKTAEFKEALSVESGSDNTRTTSETSLATTISDSLQLKVGFTIANDTAVAPGKKNTDTMTFINLTYHL